jgi:hypothetical protein
LSSDDDDMSPAPVTGVKRKAEPASSDEDCLFGNTDSDDADTEVHAAGDAAHAAAGVAAVAAYAANAAGVAAAHHGGSAGTYMAVMTHEQWVTVMTANGWFTSDGSVVDAKGNVTQKI